MPNISHSLKSLKFDKKLKDTFTARYLSNPRLVILILLFIVTIGITSFLALPRNLNPSVNIPIVFVQTILPGANPGDVEQLVTIPLEEPIRAVENVKTVTSSSVESASAITIEFRSGTDVEKARSDVQAAVQSVTTLPKDTLTPKVMKLDFENTPVLIFDLTTQSDEGSLFRFSTDLQKKLKNLSQIGNVQINGLEKSEVQLEIKPEALSSYNISPLKLMPTIQSALKAYPLGVVQTKNSTFQLSIDPQVTTVDDIRNLRINLSDANVALGDIAQISEHSSPDQNESYLLYPKGETQRAVSFSIYKSKSVSIDTAVAASEDLIGKELAKNLQFKRSIILNTSEEINDEFAELQKDFTITIILVVLVLFIFLGTRQALVSALSAPLSFLITFIIMRLTGITLNFLSLFSLILALGLLVDDTVVVMSAMTSYYKTGRFTPLQTGLLVWRDFLVPVLTTTVTTIWAFLPLLMSSGIIGEFIKSMPIVVSTSLAASFLVSVFLTLPLIIILLEGKYPRRVKILVASLIVISAIGFFALIIPKNIFGLLAILALAILLSVTSLVKKQIISVINTHIKKSKLIKNIDFSTINHGILSFDAIHKRYVSLIERILTSRTTRLKVIAMVVVLLLFSVSLLIFGFVKNEFFPRTDQDTIYMTLELPPGTKLDVARQKTQSILKDLQNTSELTFITANIGQAFSDMGPSSSGQNNVLFTINLTKHKQRHIPSFEIAQKVREKFNNYQDGTIKVQEVSGGPPAGADVQIKLLGNDLSQLDSYANKVEDYLKTQNGVTNIDKSIKAGTSKLVFVPDPAQLAQSQIGVDQVALYLRTYGAGFSVDKNKFAGETENKDITLRFNSQTEDAKSVYSINIPTNGSSVPLSSLGKLILEPNPTVITREDGNRTISVTAAVLSGFNPQSINTNLGKYADTKLNLAEGYSWKTGGANEENQKSVQSILQAMVISFLLIVTTMVLQFASFRRALIVMLVIPLSVSGVFIIFALTHTSLSFPALVGVMALFGIVVKNSILVVDKIVKNQNQKMPLIKAISDASASRLEPIALTSLAAILGLIPITLSDPLWRGLGGAIISGLTFSGTIMLFFIPVVYYQIYKGEVK